MLVCELELLVKTKREMARSSRQCARMAGDELP